MRPAIAAEEAAEVRMTFVEHLEELRARLLKAVIALLVAVTLAFVFYRELVEVATLPHFRAMRMLGIDATLVAESYTAPIHAMMLLAFTVGTFFASPVIFHQAWGFIRSGLYEHERRWVRLFAPVSFLLFVLGCMLGYFILIPYVLFGMASLLPLDKVQPLFALGDYLTLFLTLTIALGALFQLPLVMVFLSRIGLIAPWSYGRFRKHAMVGSLLAASFLAPGDPLSLLLMAAPPLILHEVGIGASRLVWGT